MSSVSSFRKMNWFPKASAWDDAEARRTKRREMMEAFEYNSASLAAGFSKANAIQIQGVGQIAAQTVQARLSAKVEELSAELENRVASFDKLV